MSGTQPDPGTPSEPPRSYASMPAPMAPEASITRVEPPTDVRRASMILYVTAAWSVLNLILSFVNRDGTEQAIRDAQPAFSESEVSAAANLSLGVAAVIGLGFGFLYYLCGRKMLEGRNWARITPTVLIGLGVLSSAAALGSGNGGGAGSTITLVIGALLGIAFLVFAWRRPANEFFKTARTPR
jgi:hypothetical protein